MLTFDETLQALQALDPSETHDSIVYANDFQGVLKQNEDIDSRRWVKVVEEVYFFPAEQRYLAISYEVGLTEQQDTDPNSVAYEVIPVEKTIIEYKALV